MRRAGSIAAFCLLSPLLAVSLAAPIEAGESATPAGLDRVLEMVKAGVGEPIILRQVAAAGPGFTVGIDEVLALKRAGASDDLIDGLMSLAGVEAPDGSAPPAAAPIDDEEDLSFRIYRERDASGQEVIHITNLDAAGHRIGGPVADNPPAPGNLYVPRDPEPSPGSYGGYSGIEDDGWGDARARTSDSVPTVVVQVFQPEAEQVAITRDAGGYGRAAFLGGYLPGYGPGRCGLRCARVHGVPSPPGSWSHYKRYHAADGGGHSGLYNGGLAYRQAAQFGFRPGARPGYALPVPFNTAGAAQLNRMRANVRLGH